MPVPDFYVFNGQLQRYSRCRCRVFVCLFFAIFIVFTVFPEQGMDLLAQLGLLTNMQFSCPTVITGSFSRGLYANDSTEATYMDPIKLMSFAFHHLCPGRIARNHDQMHSKF